MKLLITLSLAIAAAVGFALIAQQDPGYVVLARAPYTVRLPLALFALIALALFAGFYLLFNFIATLFRAPKRWREWRRRRHQAIAQRDTMRGYAGLIEGDWSKAEKQLLSQLQHNQSPLMNYLGAAYAAQQQSHPQRRDRYLADALQQHPKQRLAICLTAARLHYQAGEMIESRDALEKLRRMAPNNAPAARLLADVYGHLQEWHSLTAMMPALARLKAFPPRELASRKKHAVERYLASPSLPAGAGGRPLDTFQSLPAALKKDPQVIASQCRQLLKAGRHNLAEKTLRRALNRGWDAELAYLYGKAETSFTRDQIKLAESWAKRYGAHVDLTLTLARLYRRERQFSQAQALFAQVISAGGREEACADLGSLLEELGDPAAALTCYRQGMAALAPDAELAAEIKPPEVLPVVR